MFHFSALVPAPHRQGILSQVRGRRREFSGGFRAGAVALCALTQPQPLICVRDVAASSRWYQRLLGCQSGHGGDHYEQLVLDGRLVMQLHRWDVEHHHGRIGDPNLARGNGVLLWFELEDFDAAAARAAELKAEVILPRHRNPPEGGGGPNHWEIWLRDPDGYTVVLASPYGTADGDWKPPPGGPFRGV